ncbi:RTA1-domain-containing protein [Ceratobasidium sp. AG-I]|nr:RTA1-domain-containing protein [Ceratobasidium sp. AG-I]
MTPSPVFSLAPAFLALVLQAACVTADDGLDYSKSALGFIPKKPVAIISGIIYVLTVVVSAWWYRRHPSRYMLTIMIAGVCYAAGLFLRVAFANDPHSSSIIIPMQLLTVLSPCGFIATVYMLLSRLSYHIQAEDLLIIKPTFITKIFVTSDIVTLLVQGAGGAMESNENRSSAELGHKLFLIGLIVQLISFILYMVVFLVFLYRVRTWRSVQWNTRPDGFSKHWLALVSMMCISCVGILIRSVFRTIENAQGFGGYLATHEGYFYLLDCLPLWIAVVVFNITWPPIYLTGYKEINTSESRSGSGDVAIEMGTRRVRTLTRSRQ